MPERVQDLFEINGNSKDRIKPKRILAVAPGLSGAKSELCDREEYVEIWT